MRLSSCPARIRTFIKVVEAGSFSAAARLDSSVSSVARQVKSLEDELGVRLINRSTRRLSLTEPGQLFYERARSIAADLGNAKREASSFQDNVKGVLRVSLRVSTGTTGVSVGVSAGSTGVSVGVSAGTTGVSVGVSPGITGVSGGVSAVHSGVCVGVRSGLAGC